MFCTKYGQDAGRVDTYKWREAALIGGGPSFAGVDREALRASGLLTLTLNNAVISYRSDLWLGVDPPRRFVRWLWTDTSIQKFTPQRHRGKPIAGDPPTLAGDCPSTFFYRQNQWFKREQMFAPHDPLIWDNRNGHGCRTSLMDAIRVLYLLGVRRIYLFGVDFYQSSDHTYHYPKRPGRRNIDYNNNLYKWMSKRFARLRPLMEEAGLNILNCNPRSRLEVFDFSSPQEILQRPINKKNHLTGSASSLSISRTKQSILLITGMKGLGDNIYSRPFVKAACKRHDHVYLQTPWPQFYWDMQEEYGLRFIKPHTRLRTQNKNITSVPAHTWSQKPEVAHEATRIRYGQHGLRRGQSIIEQIESALSLGKSDFDFTIPLKPRWVAEADALFNDFNTNRPIAIYRPTTLRRDWSAPARNPASSVVQAVSRWLSDRYYVVSIADLKERQEWIAIPGEVPDKVFHQGEIRPGVLAALMQRVDLTVTPVGFALPMALAVGARVLTMYGGSVKPQLLVDPRINQSSCWHVAPEPFCNCARRHHTCNKHISPGEVSRVLTALWDQTALCRRVLSHRELVWWPTREMGFYPVRPGDMPYDESYFQKYAGLGKTPIGLELNRFRAGLVNRYTDGMVLDFGIGSGTFVETRGLDTRGFDINPHGVRWLQERRLYLDPFTLDDIDSVTFWDSLEHVRAPWEILSKIGRFVFVSMPIYRNYEHVMRSKHFKPNEHYWYFTRDGLVRWMSDAGFDLLEETDAESRLGREDIGTFVFARRQNVATHTLLKSPAYAEATLAR